MAYEIMTVIKSRYKPRSYTPTYYETCRSLDVLNFLETEDFKLWLSNNSEKASKLNKSLTIGIVVDIFSKGCNFEYLGSLPFKNFKKEFGKLIIWKESERG